MAFDARQIQDIYRRRARHYDVTANLYYLLGFREYSYRVRAVHALRLRPGDRVVEIGCGTGLNFALLQKRVGPEGIIVGVDLTDAMLEQARRRAERKGWKNVELVHSPAGEFEFPEGAGGVLSTFALTLAPDYDDVIRRAAQALLPQGHIAILDFQVPRRWPGWLVRLWLSITRPFAVTLDLAERRPWESVRAWCDHSWQENLYFGLAYLCVGVVDGETAEQSRPGR